MTKTEGKYDNTKRNSTRRCFPDLVFQNDVVVRTAGTDNASIIILINMEKIAASKNV